MLLLCALIVGTSSAWAQSDYSATYTSNVTLPTSGTQATSCTISIGGENYTGTKLGKSGGGGAASITAPIGTRYIHLHVAAWKDKSPNFTYKVGSGTSQTIDGITSNTGIANTSPFTWGTTAGNSNPNSTNHYKVIDLGSALESATTITFASGSERVVFWGVNTEAAAVAISSIAFSEPKTASVGVGGTTTLTPTVLPANHTEVLDWESDATGVATVNSSGVVTGVAAGIAHITAKAHDNPSTIYDVCTITVTAPVAVTSVSLKSSTTLLLGGTETLEATVLPNDATNKNVSWSSADDTKVSVDENGVITGLALTNGTPVNITVTTEDGGKTAVCAVTVNPIPVSSVSLDKTSGELIVGKTLTLSETVSPDNATNKSVTWESDDETVATVDEDGKVTAVAEGTVKITVKSVADPTKKAECTITVREGSINLSTTGEITFGSWSTSILGSSYGGRECALTGSDDNTYYWNEVDGYYNNGGWQIKKSTGKVTSPVIKSNYGFTISTTKGTNDVIISDGTTSGINTLTTTKTSTTITIVGDGAYAVFTKISIVPLKAPVATEVAISDPGTLAKDAMGTFAYTATTEEGNTPSWTSATTSVINITNAATGAYTAAGRGTSKITLTLTPTDATTYEAVSAERIVTVMQPVEITASNVEMTYGDAAEAIGATTSAEYAGTLTYESGNTSIATVDASGNVTAVAAGTTTITISASADASHYYTAGEDVEIEVTVNAPAGRTTAKTTTPVVVTSNTLLSSSLPTGWTGDGEIWSASSSYGAVAANGTIGNSYDLKTPSINLNGNYTAASVTFQHTGKSFSTPSDACKLYVKDGDTETPLTISTMFTGSNWTYVTNTTDLSAYIGKSIQLIFRYAPSSGNQGTWEVKNFVVNATPASTESVTLNADGYATFCSEYPLDFSDYETADYSAWYVTSANTSTGVITFSQIKGTIKGGQGILLKGTPNATITLNSVNSSNELSGNILVGCLAPTYVNQVATYYALVHVDTPEAHSEFQNLGSYTGIIPAGKAYLDLTSLGAAPDRLRIVFEGNNATNIENIEANEKAVKYLENGRILIKKNGITYDTLGRIVK